MRYLSYSTISAGGAVVGDWASVEAELFPGRRPLPERRCARFKALPIVWVLEERIDSIQGLNNAKRKVLTDGFLFVEANGTLALTLNNATCVEYMVALEDPEFLPILSEIEFEVASVTPIATIDYNSLTKVLEKSPCIVLRISRVQGHG